MVCSSVMKSVMRSGEMSDVKEYVYIEHRSLCASQILFRKTRS